MQQTKIQIKFRIMSTKYFVSPNIRNTMNSFGKIVTGVFIKNIFVACICNRFNRLNIV